MRKKIYLIYQIPKFIEGYDFIEEKECLYPEYMELYSILDDYEDAKEFIKNNTTCLDEHCNYFIALVTNEIGDICQTNSTFEIFKYEIQSNQYIKIKDDKFTILKNRDIQASDFIYLPKKSLRKVYYNNHSYIIYPKFIDTLNILQQAMKSNIRTDDILHLINKSKTSLYTILSSKLNKEDIDTALNDYMNNRDNVFINEIQKLKFDK